MTEKVLSAVTPEVAAKDIIERLEKGRLRNFRRNPMRRVHDDHLPADWEEVGVEYGLSIRDRQGQKASAILAAIAELGPDTAAEVHAMLFQATLRTAWLQEKRGTTLHVNMETAYLGRPRYWETFMAFDLVSGMDPEARRRFVLEVTERAPCLWGETVCSGR